jgi:3-hydroxyisobutyrate dehydrogenase
MRIGFIGIGNMGLPMARNLAKGAHQLTVYDSDPVRMARLADEHGVIKASCLTELSDVDLVISMLPTGKIVRDVYLAPDGGLASHLRPGTIAVDMSSSEPNRTRTLGQELDALGVALLDAPVSGGVPRAESGLLTIMIGGDNPGAIESVKPILSLMGNRLFETGGLGSGHAMKALNNFVAAAGYSAAAEALAIGQRFGLDPTRMLEIINLSTGRNFNTEMVMKEHVVDGKFATGFALGLMTKDIKTAADLANVLQVDAPLSALLSERWSSAVESLGATRDFSAAMLDWES